MRMITKDSILSVLSPVEPKTIREISEALTPGSNDLDYERVLAIISFELYDKVIEPEKGRFTRR